MIKNLLKNYNPINTIENLIYVGLTFFFMNIFVVKPIEKRFDKLQDSVIQIAMQPRYSISNDFEKMRTKKNGSIVLDFDNKLNHIQLMPMDSIMIDSTTITTTPNFWQKLFHKE